MPMILANHPRKVRNLRLRNAKKKTLGQRISERRRPATATFKALARKRRVR